MKFSTRLKLIKMGMTGKEVDGIELVGELIDNNQVLIDKNARSKKIVELIRQNRSLTSETGILRETLKKVCDKIDLRDEEFEAYNTMVEECISEVPEEENNND